MTRIRLATRIFAAVVVVCLFGVAAASYNTFRTDLEALRRASQENIYWSAAQLEVEISRFTDSLGRFGVGIDETDSQVVQDRFDILWSRLDLFLNGEIARLLSASGQSDAEIAGLYQALREEEEAVFALKRDDTAEIARLIRRFAGHSASLRDLSVRVYASEEDRDMQVRDSMRQSAMQSAILAGVALIVGMILVVLFYLEIQRARRDAERSERLRQEAESANLAKSRFLTMMSHELRTPMNGIIGSISLVRQVLSGEREAAQLSRAEYAARQMNDVLTSILDYSAVQAGELGVVSAPFQLTGLRDDLVRSVSCVADGQVAVSIPRGAPETVIGDRERLQKALGFMLTHVLQIAGVERVALEMSHADGAFQAQLTYEYPQMDGAEWSAEALYREPENKTGQFATDNIGPALARAMIARLNGQVAPGPAVGGRLCVMISIPMEAVETKKPLLALDVASATTEMLCRAALAAEGVRVVAAAELADDSADVILYEARGDGDADALRRLRAASPDARVIAIGATEGAVADTVIPLPLEVHTLRAALSARGPNDPGAAGRNRLWNIA